MSAEDVDWGALRHHCAARAWWEAWCEADTSDEGEQTPSERYIIDMARACGQTPEAVRAWQRAYGRVGYGRIQQLAAWHEPEAPEVRVVHDGVGSVADLAGMIAAATQAASVAIPQVIEFNRQVTAMARVLMPHQRARRGK